MSTVRSLLNTMQQSELYTIAPDATVYQALEMMRGKAIGALLVMEGEKLRGIVTERDYCWKVELENLTAKTTLVREIMTPADKVFTVTPFTTLEECMALMDSHRIRHLPVIKNGVVGIVSIRDVVRGIVEYQIFLLQQFQGYISGRT